MGNYLAEQLSALEVLRDTVRTEIAEGHSTIKALHSEIRAARELSAKLLPGNIKKAIDDQASEYIKKVVEAQLTIVQGQLEASALAVQEQLREINRTIAMDTRPLDPEDQMALLEAVHTAHLKRKPPGLFKSAGGPFRSAHTDRPPKM
jgi:hypothetical protein